MLSSQHALQLLQGSLHSIGHLSSPICVVSGVLKFLGPAESNRRLRSTQIRAFGDASAVATDRQDAATSNSVEMSSSSFTAAASTAAGAAAGGAASDSTAAAVADKQTRKQHDRLTDMKADALRLAGLWVSPNVYKCLSAQQKEQLHQRQQQYTNAIGKQPGTAHLSVMSLNPHQLQVVVTLTTEASSGSSSSTDAPLHNSSSSSTLPRQKRRHDIKKEQQQQQQRRKQQQEQQYSGNSRNSPALGFDFISKPKLGRRSLVPVSSELLIVNLNTQMRNALVQRDYALVVHLFDSMIAKGTAEAEELAAAAQAKAEAAAAAAAAAQDDLQTGDQQQQQQQHGELVLPLQYCPDHDAIASYCKALSALGDQQVKPNQDRFTPGLQSHRCCTIQRAEQAAALWGTSSAKGPGLAVLVSLLMAYTLAGEHKKALEVFHVVRQANPSGIKSYKLHLQALQAAVTSHDFAAANELARAFSEKRVAYTSADYKMRLSFLYTWLVRGAAAQGCWEDAIYWLQELINHELLVPVAPGNFLQVMMQAAAQRRMDVVKTMMGAVDQHLAQQRAPPLVYCEDELCYIISAAGRMADTALIAACWQRLRNDVHSQSSSRPSALQSPPGAFLSRAVRSTAPVPGTPSPAAFCTVINAYVESKQYGTALKYIAEMEELYKGSLAASVYGGLHFFPQMLGREEDIAAAFAALQDRKNAGEPVSTTMMNVICRAIGRLGNTETTGKVFEGYGGWGLTPDADSYNALIEACKFSKRITAIESLMSYMSSKGVEPNAFSYNMLLATALKAGDGKAVYSAVQRMQQGDFLITSNNAQLAMHFAHQRRDYMLRRLMLEVNEKQQLGLPARVLYGKGVMPEGDSMLAQQQHQRDQPDRRPGADVWRPGMAHSSVLNQQDDQQQQQGQSRDKQQQGQQQQQQQSTRVLDDMFDQESGQGIAAARTLRAGLRAALGSNGDAYFNNSNGDAK